MGGRRVGSGKWEGQYLKLRSRMLTPVLFHGAWNDIISQQYVGFGCWSMIAMNSNPYASPDSINSRHQPPVSRQERAELAAIINRYLNDEITAFEFDDELQRFCGSTDAAVRFVATDLWHYYDDFEDHPVVLSRAGWGYLQRLLLLLESDASIETANVYRWSWTQLVAIVALVGMVAVVTSTGWGDHLWIYAIPFGLISYVLAIRATQADTTQPYRTVLCPFTTFSDLHAAYQRVGFKKVHYPRSLRDRKIRPASSHLPLHLQWFMGAMFWAPIMLLFQSFPTVNVESKVVLPRSYDN